MVQPVIIGSGLAGLAAALYLAPHPVTLVSRARLGEQTSSQWAQGGVAAALGAQDKPEFHAVDTLAAGAGLCQTEIVDLVTRSAPQMIRQLAEWGVAFDRDVSGDYRLGLEGVHSQRRIVHALGDSTGAAIIRALIAKVRATPSITLIEEAVVTQLLTRQHKICGLMYQDTHNRQMMLPATQIILATGGAGALWQHTTNPLGSWGQGLALAARAGAVLADLEFMQFHPTAMNVGLDPMPLASEALRGEGAWLIDDKGQRFFPEELAPRDVVTRAIYAHQQKGHQVFLDTRQAIGKDFAKRFPTVSAYCQQAGIDPVVQPIPISPAAHYHMGGVQVDANGRSSVQGLYACGEVAATGLHGANRLASNSLLEAIVCAERVAQQVISDAPQLVQLNPKSVSHSAYQETDAERTMIRKLMTEKVGVLRDAIGIQQAIDRLEPLIDHSDMALVAYMVAKMALQRQESRGAHNRLDFLQTSSNFSRSSSFTLNETNPHEQVRTA